MSNPRPRFAQAELQSASGGTPGGHHAEFMSKPLKAIPKFANEAEERVFWEKHDSTDYLDWTKAERAVLPNLKPTTKTISLRLPQHLLDSIAFDG